RGFDDTALAEIYLPHTFAGLSQRVVVLARSDPAGIARPVVGQIYAIDPAQPVMDVRSIDNALQEGAFAGPRFNLVLFSAFAALGLTLAMLGVFGVMSNAVAQQSHEVGVRMAIGASPRSVFAMVVGRGARLLAVGIVLGLTASAFSARLLAT